MEAIEMALSSDEEEEKEEGEGEEDFWRLARADLDPEFDEALYRDQVRRPTMQQD